MAAKNVALVVLVLGVILGQAAADFIICYSACYASCIIEWKRKFRIIPKKFLPCLLGCLKHCIFHPESVTNAAEYCNLGCSLSKCEDFIDDPAKLEGCTLDCSNNHCKSKA